jgi:hypothetical protein
MTLDSSNISSQVINWGENIPEQWNVVSNTWALTWLVLSVYTWSIAIDDDNSEKEIVIEKIKDAYTWSVLASSDIYEYIFSASWELENVTLVNSLVLKDDITEVTVIPDPYETCISWNNPSVFPATTTYWNCDIPDFIVCRWLQIWFTIAGCNVGTDVSATAFNDTNWYWELFQWWNNTGIKSASTSWTQISVTSTWSTHSHPDFITNASDWNSTTNDNLWWDTPWTPLDRKWPCDAWYHIPSGDDWLSLHTALWFSWDWLAYSNAIKLPMAGQRAWSDWAYRNEGYYWHNRGFYWSSSPTWLQSFHFVHYSWYVQPKTNMGRSTWLSVRCFKN